MKQPENLNEKPQRKHPKKSKKPLLPASRREYLDNLEAHRIRASKKTLLKEQQDYESSTEIQEFINGNNKV
jgi:hypothetical protein